MLSGDLVEAIAAAIHEPAFATTDSNTMCNNLERSGFMRAGTDWQGSKGTLSLWVIDPGSVMLKGRLKVSQIHRPNSSHR